MGRLASPRAQTGIVSWKSCGLGPFYPSKARRGFGAQERSLAGRLSCSTPGTTLGGHSGRSGRGAGEIPLPACPLAPAVGGLADASRWRVT